MTSTLRATLVAVVALLLAASGCGPAAIGESCSDSSGCATGLQCIPAGSQHIVDGGLSCVATDLLCSIPCNTDADCSSMPGTICLHDCFSGSCLMGTH